MIKYRYALDQYENLVDIQDLERIEVLQTDKFYSIDFKLELIPRLGNIKQKHFAHKPNIENLGTGETYLHALGKKIFYDEYLFCLKNNKSVYFKYTIEKYCNRLQKEYNITCRQGNEIGKFDLTKYFTEILIEKRDDNFIPDILLLNPTTREKIYIEIAVTHASSNNKKHSGNRIIEFNISTENEALLICDFLKQGGTRIVHYYNFKKKEVFNACCEKGNCVRLFNFFSVSQNGKCNLLILKENAIQLTLEKYQHNSIWHKLEPNDRVIDEEFNEEDSNSNKIFKNYLAKAYQENVKVKNCYICRYHARNTSWDYVSGEPIFCKFQKITCGSNYAATCQFYKAEQKYVNSYLEQYC